MSRKSVAAFADQIGDSLSPLKPFRLQECFRGGREVAELAGPIFEVFRGSKIHVSGHRFFQWRS
jgi:hypothetical protein